MKLMHSANKYLTQLAASASIPFTYVNKAGIYLIANDAWLQIIGKKREDVIGHTIHEALGEVVYGLIEPVLKQCYQGESAVYNGWVSTANDGYRYYVTTMDPHFDEDGEFQGILGYSCDITEYIQQEITAENPDKIYFSLLSNMPEPMVVFNIENRKVIYINPAFTQLYGYSLTEIIGKDIADFRVWKFQEDKDFYEKLIREGKVKGFDTIHYSKSGEELPVRITSVLTDFQGEQCAVNWAEDCGEMYRQEAEKKRLEEQLFQAQKLESLGRLSAGLAHEINTPAQYVSDNLFFLKDILPDVSAMLGEILSTMSVLKQKAGTIPELAHLQALFEKLDAEFIIQEISTALDHSLEGMERINRIVVATNGFSYNGSKKVETNINEAISKTITLCSHEWKYVAEIETDFAQDLPAVPCFISSINQVVLNMLVNAAQAIKSAELDGKLGKITVSTRQAGDNVLIRVADDGCGMSEGTLKKIFDPFFTTKPVGIGTGQGLAIAYRIINEQHGGMISVDSTPGKGTCFTISLPLTDDEEGSDRDEVLESPGFV